MAEVVHVVLEDPPIENPTPFDGIAAIPFLRQDFFLIVGVVQCVAVMTRMADGELLMVNPTDEGEHSFKQPIEPLRLEHRSMAQLMHGIDGERA